MSTEQAVWIQDLFKGMVCSNEDLLRKSILSITEFLVQIILTNILMQIWARAEILGW